MMNLLGTSCCGMKTLSGFEGYKDPHTLLQELLDNLMNIEVLAFIVFSLPEDSEIGNALTAYLHENDLATVTKTCAVEPAKNATTKYVGYMVAFKSGQIKKWFTKNSKTLLRPGDKAKVNSPSDWTWLDLNKGDVVTIVSSCPENSTTHYTVRRDIDDKEVKLVGREYLDKI